MFIIYSGQSCLLDPRHSSDVINIVKSKLTFYPLLSGLTSDPRAGSSKGHVAVEEANKRSNQSILFSMQSNSNKDWIYTKEWNLLSEVFSF